MGGPHKKQLLINLKKLDQAVNSGTAGGEHYLRRAHILDQLGRNVGALDAYRLAAMAFLSEGHARKAHAAFQIVLSRDDGDETAQRGLIAAEHAMHEGRILTRTAPERTTGERRRTIRVPWPGMVDMWATVLHAHTHTGNRIQALRGMDVSTNGIGVEAAAKAFVIGSYLEIDFRHPSFPVPGWARARVARLPSTEQPGVGLHVDWIDPQTLGYLLSVISRESGLPVDRLENMREAAYHTPVFDFADWQI